ncbi:MAG: hypothetical protein OXG17_04800 [Chloroflexi bacterium]|nr:hypothetical protein [Chloroflexota bacterium]
MNSQETYREVPLANLRLDPENPRLPRESDGELQSENHFLREFSRRYNLIELARSIVDKGFSPRHAEALLVVEEESKPGDYVVVEGNRRLATLKLLTDVKSRKAAGVIGIEWEELAEKAMTLNLNQVPVIVYHDRTELNDYLGFRHITGPKPWRPEAKARFIVKLLGAGESVGDVARGIGSNHRTVRRFAEAHEIYEQALSAEIPMDEVEAAFGVFYNALDREGVREYLSLGRQADISQLPKAPVPPDSMDELRELIGLLYGDSSRNLERVIRESRDLRKLSDVLADDRARANLLQNRNLERAWRVSGGGRYELLGQLSELHSGLAEVNGKAREYADDNEVRDEIRRIHNLVMEMASRYGVNDS